MQIQVCMGKLKIRSVMRAIIMDSFDTRSASSPKTMSLLLLYQPICGSMVVRVWWVKLTILICLQICLPCFPSTYSDQDVTWARKYTGIYIFWMGKHVMFPRSVLHGYFNPLVFWYQWDYLQTSKEFIFCRVSKIGNGSLKALGKSGRQSSPNCAKRRSKVLVEWDWEILWVKAHMKRNDSDM